MNFVSCICPTTASRRAWLAKAIACFWSQNYEGGAEMIIVEDSSPEKVPLFWAPHHAEREGSPIRVAALAGTIGAKRNYACSLAKGEIIVHFDDDDFSAPGRVMDQVNRLVESGKAVTSYRNLRFTDGRQTWVNRNWPGGYGTSLAYRRDWWLKHPFSDTSDSEDWHFVQTAMRANEFIAADAGDKMYATIHPGNTSPRVIGHGWEPLSPPAL